MNAIEKAIEVLQGCLDHPGADDAIAGLRAAMEPLTRSQIVNCYESALSQKLRPHDEYGVVSFCRAVEAAHGITKGCK